MAIVIKNTMGIQICESRLIEASLFLRVHSPESRLCFLSEEPTRADNDDADEQDGDDDNDEEARRRIMMVDSCDVDVDALNERELHACGLHALHATKRTNPATRQLLL